MRKLVLIVIDGLTPTALERGIESGTCPTISQLAAAGQLGRAISAFPSLTPVCLTSIATGALPGIHHIPHLVWFDREQGRVVEYGSSFAAARRSGALRWWRDTIYAMNAEHLSHDTPTVFESLDDAEVRTAGTTYLIYRGRHQHEVAQETALARIVTSTLFRRTIDGPLELFYADLYASRSRLLP